MRLSTRLQRAIEDFENENLDMTLGERISGLRSALLYDAFHKLKKLGQAKRNGEKMDEDTDHIDRMKYFSDIEKMYVAELKMNKLTGKSNEIMDKEFLKRIKEEKGSMGNIVRDIRETSTGTNG